MDPWSDFPQRAASRFSQFGNGPTLWQPILKDQKFGANSYIYGIRMYIYIPQKKT